MRPWLDHLRIGLHIFAGQARELAAHAPGELADLSEPLERLADHLDRAAHERLLMGSGWDEMSAAARAAIDQARAIKSEWIDQQRIDARSIEGLRETVTSTSRKLRNPANRVDEMAQQSRIEEIQSDAGDYGLVLLKAAEIGVGLGDEDRLAQLAASAVRFAGSRPRGSLLMVNRRFGGCSTACVAPVPNWTIGSISQGQP